MEEENGGKEKVKEKEEKEEEKAAKDYEGKLMAREA